MGITKSGTRVTLEYVTGDPFGNTADPFNYQRVVDFLDPANYKQEGNTIIFIDISIYIQGAETAFMDSGKNVTYTGSVDDIRIERAGSEVAKHELTNCSFDSQISGKYWTDYTTDEYVSCRFYNFRLLLFHGYFKRCYLYGMEWAVAVNDNHFINTVADNFNRSIWVQGLTNFNNFQVIGSESGLWLDARYLSGEIEILNSQLIDCDNEFDFYLHNADPTIRLTNSVGNLTNRLIVVGGGTTGSMTAILQQQFRTNIENSSGGTLTITDKDGNQIYSEVLASDSMTEQKIEYDRLYLENTDGVLTAEERTINEPFTLKVTKTGYQDLEIPNIRCTELQDDGSRKGTLSAKLVSGKMEELVIYEENMKATIKEETINAKIEEEVIKAKIVEE